MPSPAPALVEKAVAVVEKGELWASPGLIARLVEELAASHRIGALPVGGGAANKEIARHLGVIERTVKAHRPLARRAPPPRSRRRWTLVQ